uniref:Uncharacterized protein n=1 Tax=Arundo donax TaxID=35708 RepID=A0A0A9H895_ARUDO
MFGLSLCTWIEFSWFRVTRVTEDDGAAALVGARPRRTGDGGGGWTVS